MKTIVLEKPLQFEMTDTPEPGDIPAGWARVRVRRVGICGTDWHAFHGRQPFFSYPRILGHELGVEIEALTPSPGVSLLTTVRNSTLSAQPRGEGDVERKVALKPGDKCAVEPYLNCGKCIACRRGKSNCCAELKVLGVHIDGGMRDRILVPLNKLHKSETLSFDQLALVETLGIGCHAVSRAGIEPGENVLIVGAGPIGLSVIPFVIAAGGVPIVADISESRLAFCRGQMKVRTTLDARGDIPALLRQNLSGDLPTVVIDATGNPPSMMKTFETVAPGGKIVFVGLFQGEVTFNDPNFHRRETTLLASRNALPGDFGKIIKLIEAGAVDTTPWITHRAPAEKFIESLPAWEAPEANLLKAVLEF